MGSQICQVLPPLPAPIARSPLMRKGGVEVLDGLLAGGLLRQLQLEAMACWPRAARQDVGEEDPKERGGMPPRRFFTAGGGPVQKAMYDAVWMHRTLESVVGVPVETTGSQGTYSYYVEPGDYLDLHRDIVTCDIAAISLLFNDGAMAGEAGSLCIYPKRCREPLASIRKDIDRDAYLVQPEVGQTVVLMGGVVPHRVLPVPPEQRRIISVLCYRAAIY